MTEFPAPAGFRWVRMVARLERTLDVYGIPVEDRLKILRAHGEAGVFREGHVPPDEDHPDWLHPGRTLLVLLEDGKVRDPQVLSLAPSLDQLYPVRIPSSPRNTLDEIGFPFLGGGLGGHADADEDQQWLEAALELEPALLTLLVAEGLDQVRHLHLLPPSAFRTQFVGRGVNLLAPLAYRIGGTLERRFRWWTRRVAPTLAGPEVLGSSSARP